MAVRGEGLIPFDEPKIRIRDLHKEFVLHDVHIGTLKNMILRRKPEQRHRREIKKVLRGISFDVHRRECVAIMGRNGAGKSTMLGVVARIHQPTQGFVEVHGRVAPLLELGSGFHPDLTGIENVYFNGMLLGLTHEQITERMDEIVRFSEIGNYVNEPIRTYSSGMIARLGFSVATHVDAEILIVDESLAVGDYRFVQKCYRFIRQFQSRGGTILFVSHSAAAVRDIATRCIWLENGLLQMDGSPDEVIEAYQGKAASPESAAN